MTLFFFFLEHLWNFSNTNFDLIHTTTITPKKKKMKKKKKEKEKKKEKRKKERSSLFHMEAWNEKVQQKLN
jgi:hypothetical protein